MQITLDTIVVAAAHQISAPIDNEAALLNLQTGVYYGLDAMGAYIWQWLKEPISVRGLQERLLREYDVDAAIVEADLRHFLTEMLSAGLVEVKPESSGAPS
jgi:hypothetical protein